MKGIIDILEDGTLVVSFEDRDTTKIGRVLVCDSVTKNGTLYYPEGDYESTRQEEADKES